MLKFTLNLHKPNNYAFFCPVSKLHLTVSNPVGYASEVTPAILRAIKANTIIDVDNKIDLEAGTIKKIDMVELPVKQPEEKLEKPVVLVQEELEEPEVPEQKEQPPVKKKSRKQKETVK